MTDPLQSRYYYDATVVSVYDGDTVTLRVDLGFGISSTQKFRLLGIDTPEIRGVEREDGLRARDFLRSQIPYNSDVLIRTHRDRRGKYGRYLATIYRRDQGRWEDLNQKMVSLGYAEVYDL